MKCYMFREKCGMSSQTSWYLMVLTSASKILLHWSPIFLSHRTLSYIHFKSKAPRWLAAEFIDVQVLSLAAHKWVGSSKFKGHSSGVGIIFMWFFEFAFYKMGPGISRFSSYRSFNRFWDSPCRWIWILGRCLGRNLQEADRLVSSEAPCTIIEAPPTTRHGAAFCLCHQPQQ